MSPEANIERISSIRELERILLRSTLQGLVDLKHHKDTVGKTPWYEEAMPKAWARAKEALGLVDLNQFEKKLKRVTKLLGRLDCECPTSNSNKCWRCEALEIMKEIT